VRRFDQAVERGESGNRHVHRAASGGAGRAAGHVIYQVSGAPVVLLDGNVPAWRDLSEGVTGPDVTELNADLVKLRYASQSALGPRSGWDYFSGETAYALGLMQAHLGLTVTGTLPLGQAVFLPCAARITGLGATTVLSAAAAPGTAVLTATSTSPVVSIALDAGQETEVKKGDKVGVILPNGTTTPGVISSVGIVAHLLRQFRQFRRLRGHGRSGWLRGFRQLQRIEFGDHHRAGIPDRPESGRQPGPGPGHRRDHHRQC
jgi:hypothetical protein